MCISTYCRTCCCNSIKIGGVGYVVYISTATGNCCICIVSLSLLFDEFQRDGWPRIWRHSLHIFLRANTPESPIKPTKTRIEFYVLFVCPIRFQEFVAHVSSSITQMPFAVFSNSLNSFHSSGYQESTILSHYLERLRLHRTRPLKRIISTGQTITHSVRNYWQHHNL